MILHFMEGNASVYLTIADKYDKDFAKLIEGVICILSANAFFSTNSAFDPDNLRQVQAQYLMALNK